MKRLGSRVRGRATRPGLLRGEVAAFSLLEILIVLIILGILSSVAIFSYGSYRQTQSVRSSAQELVSLFATARSLAINTNTPHSATLDLDHQAFWIDELTPDGLNIQRPKISGGGTPADQVVIEDLRLSTGIRTSGIVFIRFWPDGRGTLVVVHLRRLLDDPALSTSYYSVRVFPSTGATQVLPNERR